MKTGSQRPGSPARRATTLLAGRGDWMLSTDIAKAVGVRPADINAHLSCAVRAKLLWKEVRLSDDGKKSVYYKQRSRIEIDPSIDVSHGGHISAGGAGIGDRQEEPTHASPPDPAPATGLSQLLAEMQAGGVSLQPPQPPECRVFAPFVPEEIILGFDTPRNRVRLVLDDSGDLLIASEDGVVRLAAAEVLRRLFGFLAEAAPVFAVRRG